MIVMQLCFTPGRVYKMFRVVGMFIRNCSYHENQMHIKWDLVGWIAVIILPMTILLMAFLRHLLPVKHKITNITWQNPFSNDSNICKE